MYYSYSNLIWSRICHVASGHAFVTLFCDIFLDSAFLFPFSTASPAFGRVPKVFQEVRNDNSVVFQLNPSALANGLSKPVVMDVPINLVESSAEVVAISQVGVAPSEPQEAQPEGVQRMDS